MNADENLQMSFGMLRAAPRIAPRFYLRSSALHLRSSAFSMPEYE
jgi:hypothetical protein